LSFVETKNRPLVVGPTGGFLFEIRFLGWSVKPTPNPELNSFRILKHYKVRKSSKLYDEIYFVPRIHKHQPPPRHFYALT
jgi:hypothetical protein